jgi:hypothetical protein
MRHYTGQSHYPAHCITRRRARLITRTTAGFLGAAPGFGHFYRRREGPGFVWLALCIIAYLVFGPIGIIVHALSIVDAAA